ncbi:hypothetical protein KJY73_15795 [Bowmanella sp. Y26]|uniref:hypothetical protein n=1 Tax=Bowmanella yangjiangensis TaxID=2811230 RepID=UPI001BDC0725|nr:hypothetical protein [Bowmanella yangjiangensis]MBT1065055.1 hypothetical protein [Bowmanella yangjiangensis]
MTILVTAHSTKPGMEDRYEAFLRHRKLRYVRSLPGIKSYRVFRTERRFAQSTPDGTPKRYDIMAIIELDSREQDILAIYQSDAWQRFMQEYIEWLEDDPAIYLAHEIQEDSLAS